MTAELTIKLGGRFSRLENAIRKFIYTDYYLLLVSLIVFIAWVSECAPFGFIALILLSCAVLLTSDDILPLMTNIFSAVLMIYDNKLGTFLYLWPTFIPLGICVAVFIFRNRRNNFTLGKMFFPQVAVSLALLIAGVGVTSSDEYLRAFPNALFLGVGVLAVYVLFNLYIKRDNKRDITLYFTRMLMYIGFVVCLEMIVDIIRADIPPSIWHTSYWDVGWGNRNNIATYLLFTAPMCFYLSTRYKHGFPYLFAGVIQYVCIVMTFSRGGVLFGAISGFFALILSIVKAPNKKEQLISVGAIVAVVLILYFCMFSKVNDMIESLLARGTGLSGRDRLYQEAVELFKAHPALGVGLGYMGSGPSPISDLNIYLYHSTFFQIIASAGIIGLLLYCYFYGARLYILFKGIRKKFNLFVLASWIGFEGYSMIDTGTFIPFPNMMLVILMTLLLEITLNDNSCEGIADEYSRAFPLPKALQRRSVFARYAPDEVISGCQVDADDADALKKD